MARFGFPCERLAFVAAFTLPEHAIAITISSSWPGFVPAIHVFLARIIQDVDARDKRGHDVRR